LQQKETVIVRRYSTVFLLPPQSFTQGFIFRQIQELCKIIQKKFALKSTGFYVNIVQGFCKVLIMSPASSDPARIELRLD
jgi:hypothetical protein